MNFLYIIKCVLIACFDTSPLEVTLRIGLEYVSLYVCKNRSVVSVMVNITIPLFTRQNETKFVELPFCLLALVVSNHKDAFYLEILCHRDR
jgi:hypothetical protein